MSRHLVLRASSGEVLPEGLAEKLRAERVESGWLRASGILHDVELSGFDAALGTLGRKHRIAGPVQLLSAEGAIGLSNGAPSFALRGLLARETDRGLESLAGEIAWARAIALEVLVTVFDDLALERTLDATAGVWLVGGSGSPAMARAPVRPAAGSSPSLNWSSAVDASERVRTEPSAPAVTPGAVAMPQRPRPPRGAEVDMPFPEAGDVVEHFAFGRADVVKSDGDRLHLRVHKDGRIREIALEMLRVARLDDSPEGKRHFRLERRL